MRTHELVQHWMEEADEQTRQAGILIAIGKIPNVLECLAYARTYRVCAAELTRAMEEDAKPNGTYAHQNMTLDYIIEQLREAKRALEGADEQ